MPEELARLDPPGCGCTDCLIGYSKPLDQATTLEVTWSLTGRLSDATGMDWAAARKRMHEAAQTARADAVREYVEARLVSSLS